MEQLLEDTALTSHSSGLRATQQVAPLPEVMWRRRNIVVASVAIAFVMALIYVYFATRVYSATARVIVEQNAPEALAVSHDVILDTEGLLQTQVEVVQSIPVLRRACAAAAAQCPHVLAAAGKDPVEWFRTGHGLTVALDKKSDVVLVTMESAYPQEAVYFVNAIVDAYIAEQSQKGHATSDGLLRLLKQERSDKERQRDQLIASMDKYRRDNGILETQDSKGNTILDRATTLSTSLTEAQLSIISLQADLNATEAALKDPASTAAFVEAQQEKDRNAADQELNDLRNERMQYQVALDSSTIIQGAKHQHVQILQATLDEINANIQAKEKSMGEAMLASLNARLASAQQQERDLQTALNQQATTALNLSPETYANAQVDVTRLQKDLDVLDARITELSVNSAANSGPLNISVMEQASLDERPVKPNKMMVLAASLMVGLIAGMGGALMQERMDTRIRSIGEVRSLLSARVVASIPPIDSEMSAVARGQIVRLDARSAVAESYRSIRTALHLGSKLVGKTLLFVSPAASEGKSTTASNVALAFAQAGERTLLIDCDMRQPVQHLIFEVDSSIGLSDVMCGSARVRDAIRSTDTPGLFLLPCGPIPTNPSEMLGSKRFAQLMQSLGKSFDRIIIDAPPLLNVTDGCILAAAADVTLLVLRMSHSMREPAMWALEELDRVGANVLGVVANGVPQARAYRYYKASVTHYATHASRRLPFANGFATNNQPARSSNESLLIEEPQWATD
jgi:capsular exopolysaccharide synthesis family protein